MEFGEESGTRREDDGDHRYALPPKESPPFFVVVPFFTPLCPFRISSIPLAPDVPRERFLLLLSIIIIRIIITMTTVVVVVVVARSSASSSSQAASAHDDEMK